VRMRDRRNNRDVSPKYRDRHHPHVDRYSDATHRHKPTPRLVRLSSSPPIRPLHRRSPHRTDLTPRQLDYHKTIHPDYPSPHHPRSQHFPTVRDYHHDLRVPSYMHPDYPTDLSHGIKHQPHVLDPHPSGHKAMFLDDIPSRSYPAMLNQDNITGGMLSGTIHDSNLHHCHSYTQDFYGEDRDRDRDRDRDGDRDGDRDRDRDRHRHRDRDRARDKETGKGPYQREVPRPITVTTTQLGPVEGGQSSYGRGRLCYEHGLAASEDISRVALGRLPDDLRKSRDRVSDRYDKLILEDLYEKMPYPSVDYSRADDMAYSPKAVREERGYSDITHHSAHKDVGPSYHGFEQECLGRSLPRREATLPFEDRHEIQREVVRVTEREMQQNPIFPDCAKGLHRTDYSPSNNGYGDDLGYEPSQERLIAREHHLRHVRGHDHDHDHVHDGVIYDDRIFDDDDDDVENDYDGDEVGDVLNPRITVKDRLNLSSPLFTDVDHPIRYAVPSRKPVSIHGKHHHSWKMSVHAAMRTNSVKKRLQLGRSDFRKENFRARKIQRRGTDYEPNITKVNDEYEKGSDEDAANMVCPILRDPTEGSEEFNKQVEKAFFKYAKIINESTREKKKLLQHGKGSIGCYVCGRSVFFFLH
jgi:hypothetical protein